jgi:hypothetical protein
VEEVTTEELINLFAKLINASAAERLSILGLILGGIESQEEQNMVSQKLEAVFLMVDKEKRKNLN